MSGMTRLVSILVIGAVITIGISMFILFMGVLDDGADMTDSAYEDQYDSITDISIASISLMKILPIIIAVCALLIGVMGLKKYAKG